MFKVLCWLSEGRRQELGVCCVDPLCSILAINAADPRASSPQELHSDTFCRGLNFQEKKKSDLQDHEQQEEKPKAIDDTCFSTGQTMGLSLRARAGFYKAISSYKKFPGIPEKQH